MSRGAVFVAAALTSGATLAHAYTCLGAAEKRCAALRKREEELLLALEGERGKSPIRRQARTVLERELEERRLAISSLEGAREQWEAERHALGAQVEDLTQTVAREREQHERVLDEKGKELHALHARHEADIQTLHGEKLALENMLADLEKKSFAALDGLRQKLSDEQLSLERVRQALMRQEEEKVLAADAQDMLSQTLAQARKEAEKLKGDVKRLDAERARVAEELQREKDARAALELKHEQSHAERQNVEAMLERAFDERRRLASALSSMFSSLQDARLEVAASVIGAADSAQNTIRLEEQLDQERADCRDLQDQLRGMAGLRQQVEVLARERDEALAQVAEVQERDLRVIEGLMDDVAKGDVSLKQAKEEATAREDALERARDAALMDGDVLRAELEAAEQQRDALIAERDEERDAKAHALADADHVSEELMYLHGETERQVQQQTELEKKQKNAAREVNFLQEMLAKSKKRQEADAKACPSHAPRLPLLPCLRLRAQSRSWLAFCTTTGHQPQTP